MKRNRPISPFDHVEWPLDDADYNAAVAGLQSYWLRHHRVVEGTWRVFVRRFGTPQINRRSPNIHYRSVTTCWYVAPGSRMLSFYDNFATGGMSVYEYWIQKGSFGAPGIDRKAYETRRYSRMADRLRARIDEILDGPTSLDEAANQTLTKIYQKAVDDFGFEDGDDYASKEAQTKVGLRSGEKLVSGIKLDGGRADELSEWIESGGAGKAKKEVVKGRTIYRMSFSGTTMARVLVDDESIVIQEVEIAEESEEEEAPPRPSKKAGQGNAAKPRTKVPPKTGGKAPAKRPAAKPASKTSSSKSQGGGKILGSQDKGQIKRDVLGRIKKIVGKAGTTVSKGNTSKLRGGESVVSSVQFTTTPEKGREVMIMLHAYDIGIGGFGPMLPGLRDGIKYKPEEQRADFKDGALRAVYTYPKTAGGSWKIEFQETTKGGGGKTKVDGNAMDVPFDLAEGGNREALYQKVISFAKKTFDAATRDDVTVRSVQLRNGEYVEKSESFVAKSGADATAWINTFGRGWKLLTYAGTVTSYRKAEFGGDPVRILVWRPPEGRGNWTVEVQKIGRTKAPFDWSGRDRP